MLTVHCREKEISYLKKIIQSSKSEFLALYGRRRVGKTYLVRQTFKDNPLFLEISGQKDASLAVQLNNFIKKFESFTKSPLSLSVPKNWNEAFSIVTEMAKKSKKPFILFIDELPWLCKQRSGCFEALDYYWNSEWSKLRNFKLIVCGSAASWMIEKIINNKGGLHNRITHQLKIQPFTLKQTKQFLKLCGHNFTDEQIIRLTLVFGGIPYYLSLLQKGLSDVQNINALCFNQDSILFDEFEKVFRSLFEHYEDHEKIVKALANKRVGLNQTELLKATKLSSGGTFKKRIIELEMSGFISARVPLGKLKKDTLYYLSDEFCFFHEAWVRPIKATLKTVKQNNYWSQQMTQPAWYSWAGYSFEALVLKHFESIKHGLGLEGLIKNIGPLKLKNAQIDLVIERSDHILQILEIKYSAKLFVVSKEYAFNLKNKIESLHNYNKGKSQIILSLITLNGFKESAWSQGLVDSHVALIDFI